MADKKGPTTRQMAELQAVFNGHFVESIKSDYWLFDLADWLDEKGFGCSNMFDPIEGHDVLRCGKCNTLFITNLLTKKTFVIGYVQCLTLLDCLEQATAAEAK
jgi:hypothetical protein